MFDTPFQNDNHLAYTRQTYYDPIGTGSTGLQNVSTRLLNHHNQHDHDNVHQQQQQQHSSLNTNNNNRIKTFILLTATTDVCLVPISNPKNVRLKRWTTNALNNLNRNQPSPTIEQLRVINPEVSSSLEGEEVEEPGMTIINASHLCIPQAPLHTIYTDDLVLTRLHELVVWPPTLTSLTIHTYEVKYPLPVSLSHLDITFFQAYAPFQLNLEYLCNLSSLSVVCMYDSYNLVGSDLTLPFSLTKLSIGELGSQVNKHWFPPGLLYLDIKDTYLSPSLGSMLPPKLQYIRARCDTPLLPSLIPMSTLLHVDISFYDDGFHQDTSMMMESFYLPPIVESFTWTPLNLDCISPTHFPTTLTTIDYSGMHKQTPINSFNLPEWLVSFSYSSLQSRPLDDDPDSTIILSLPQNINIIPTPTDNSKSMTSQTCTYPFLQLKRLKRLELVLNNGTFNRKYGRFSIRIDHIINQSHCRQFIVSRGSTTLLQFEIRRLDPKNASVMIIIDNSLLGGIITQKIINNNIDDIVSPDYNDEMIPLYQPLYINYEDSTNSSKNVKLCDTPHNDNNNNNISNE
ncbi:hypothetical protein DFA_00531 [Cavenderia fasciculata]|uniref:Uncharacterized protein n=1 Tax=Cavenderia fasciculata TaxID=261658 RepID=F4PSC4_CACFS|nr:uncharacterized protein DFA_00531 [Cavenderia fasciculata]EGG20670.1 hypothetical protein DFA_00531 [Cavenderia fasciculata]|eukprot:XP_004358520.1 hypothetical protein DFA_00531 [Cavenderia fasciculata]